MKTSETIITQVLDENIIGAKETIRTLLIQKAKVFLEDKRRCLASISYGPCAESKDDYNCSCEEKVAEDCGCNEVEEGVGAYTLKKTKVEKNEDEDNGTQTVTHYDVMLGGKKVGKLSRDDYFGQVSGELHGKSIPQTAVGSDVQAWLHKFLKSKNGAKFAMHAEEKLSDKQKKLDKNHNGVLDKQDFAIVRGKKKKEG